MNPREMIDFERNTLKSNTFTIDRSYFSSSNPYEDAHELGMIDNLTMTTNIQVKLYAQYRLPNTIPSKRRYH
ncbi:MAG: hypothetical protein IPL33_08755 [Sphingobacteriales bacterium]|nr:hypothetical protein [Sphingobacteriales bacterium]